MLIAQISDPHVVESGELFNGRIDSAAALATALDEIDRLRVRPTVILATGDLVNDGTGEQYAELARVVGSSSIPILPIPGNHDDRRLLRRTFAGVVPDGADSTPIDYCVDEHPIRLIGLDTTVPGEAGGRLDPEQLEWLDHRLAEQPDRPTIVFQHHPPIATGIAWMDVMGLADPDDEERIIARHPHVAAVLAGHIHRPISAPFGGTIAVCAPSTAAQLEASFDDHAYHYTDEPGAILLHRHVAGRLVSHLLPIPPPATWRPPWAETPRHR